MSTIAFDGKTLAADRRMSCTNGIYECCKVLDEGDYFTAGTGDASLVLDLAAWFRGGRLAQHFPTTARTKENGDVNGCLLVVWRSGRIERYEGSPFPIVYMGPVAFGSGGDFARAAMYCGKTAAEAVAIAALFDKDTGNGVDTLEL